MIRASLLWLSEQPRIFKFVRSNRLARRFAARFVAGETVETAVGTLQATAGKGGPAAGAAVTCSVRPQALSLVSDGGPAANCSGTSSGVQHTGPSPLSGNSVLTP